MDYLAALAVVAIVAFGITRLPDPHTLLSRLVRRKPQVRGTVIGDSDSDSDSDSDPFDPKEASPVERRGVMASWLLDGGRTPVELVALAVELFGVSEATAWRDLRAVRGTED